MAIQITRVTLSHGVHPTYLASTSRYLVTVIGSKWDTATAAFYFDRIDEGAVMAIRELSTPMRDLLIHIGLSITDDTSLMMVGDLKPGGRYFGRAIMVVTVGSAEAQIAHGKQVAAVVRALLAYMRAYRDGR